MSPIEFIADLTVLPPGPLPRFGRSDVETWFTDPGHLIFDRDGLQAGYDKWQLSIGERPIPPDRPSWATADAVKGYCGHLLGLAEASSPLSFTTVWREAQGGRRYFVKVEGANQLDVLGKSPKSKYPNSSMIWLQMIPKKVRRTGLRAPAGRTLIQVDIKSAFLQFMACWSGDPLLTNDLAEDVHSRIAQALEIDRDTAKVINNSLVGLAGVKALRKNFRRAGIEVTGDYAKQLHDEWWARYERATCLRDTAQYRVAHEAHYGRGVRVRAPDGRVFRFSPAETAGRVLDNQQQRGFTSIFSSFWRAIEGVVMDMAIACLHSFRATHDLRFVLGMFDGLLYSAPADRATELELAAKQAVEWAMASVGVPGRAETIVDPYWLSKPRGA
jgi:hypothetical protein